MMRDSSRDFSTEVEGVVERISKRDLVLFTGVVESVMVFLGSEVEGAGECDGGEIE